MDLQLATNSKITSGAYKRQKGEQNTGKKAQMQQLEVKISSDGQTISFHSDSMKPSAYQSIDV